MVTLLLVAFNKLLKAAAVTSKTVQMDRNHWLHTHAYKQIEIYSQTLSLHWTIFITTEIIFNATDNDAKWHILCKHFCEHWTHMLDLVVFVSLLEFVVNFNYSVRCQFAWPINTEPNVLKQEKRKQCWQKLCMYDKHTRACLL